MANSDSGVTRTGDTASLRDSIEQIGKVTVAYIEEFGYYLHLVIESFYWILVGPFKRQPVKLPAIFEQMVAIGMTALPIVFILSFSIGVMLAIQGIHTLKQFGAEEQVVLGIALSVTREFGTADHQHISRRADRFVIGSAGRNDASKSGNRCIASNGH